jgi:hypothetical protein
VPIVACNSHARYSAWWSSRSIHSWSAC